MTLGKGRSTVRESSQWLPGVKGTQRYAEGTGSLGVRGLLRVLIVMVGT